jgi:hypothetical protein
VRSEFFRVVPTADSCTPTKDVLGLNEDLFDHLVPDERQNFTVIRMLFAVPGIGVPVLGYYLGNVTNPFFFGPLRGCRRLGLSASSKCFGPGDGVS